MAEETQAKPAAKAKKEKAPPLEAKPFPEFIQQHFLPGLQAALADQGIQDLALEFAQQPLPSVPGPEAVWQVLGTWDQGYRHFRLYFFDADISGQKGFSCSVGNQPPSTLESFMIDERKVTLDLLILYVLQRLGGEKWLGKN